MDRGLRKRLIFNVTRNVLYIRTGLGLTQVAFSNIIDVRQRNLAAMEEGRSLSIDTIYKIAKHIRVSIDTILLTNMNKNIDLKFNAGDKVFYYPDHLPFDEDSYPSDFDKYEFGEVSSVRDGSVFVKYYEVNGELGTTGKNSPVKNLYHV